MGTAKLIPAKLKLTLTPPSTNVTDFFPKDYNISLSIDDDGEELISMHNAQDIKEYIVITDDEIWHNHYITNIEIEVKVICTIDYEGYHTYEIIHLDINFINIFNSETEEDIELTENQYNEIYNIITNMLEVE